MASIGAAAGMSLSAPETTTRARAQASPVVAAWATNRNNGWAINWRGRRMVRMAAAPEKITEKIGESIKEAEQKCEEDPKSGECAAAWDEVEELSAAASHARDRKKESDPLEDYCKDNPETEECRTYED